MASGENSKSEGVQQGQDGATDDKSAAAANAEAETSPDHEQKNSATDDDPVTADASAAGSEGSFDQEQAAADELDFGDAKMAVEDPPAEPDLEQGDLENESPEQLRARLAESQELADSHWERVLRMQADMENQRKRAQKDIENARKFSLEGMVNELLPVKDSLEMGLQAASGEDADLSKIVEGSDLTLKMLMQALEKHNVIEINPVDEKFNPELHQAMSQQEVEGKDPNTVIGVLQKGYTLNDRLIRPALVMVSK